MKPQTERARALGGEELRELREALKRTISSACSQLDAVERELRRRKRKARGSGVAAAAARASAAIPALVLLKLGGALQSTQALPAAALAPLLQPDLLLIEHAYDGPVERAGVLMQWRYTGGRMLVEWSDTTTDGIFRSGFEASQ